MKKGLLDKILGILAWGLIAFALLALLLKGLGLINSPPITEILLGGIVIELFRFETKFSKDLAGIKIKLDFLWYDFRKRKDV